MAPLASAPAPNDMLCTSTCCPARSSCWARPGACSAAHPRPPSASRRARQAGTTRCGAARLATPACRACRQGRPAPHQPADARPPAGDWLAPGAPGWAARVAARPGCARLASGALASAAHATATQAVMHAGGEQAGGQAQPSRVAHKLRQVDLVWVSGHLVLRAAQVGSRQQQRGGHARLAGEHAGRTGEESGRAKRQSGQEVRGRRCDLSRRTRTHLHTVAVHAGPLLAALNDALQPGADLLRGHAAAPDARGVGSHAAGTVAYSGRCTAGRSACEWQLGARSNAASEQRTSRASPAGAGAASLRPALSVLPRRGWGASPPCCWHAGRESQRCSRIGSGHPPGPRLRGRGGSPYTLPRRTERGVAGQIAGCWHR